MISVAVVGSGNVATNLIEAFLSNKNIQIKYIYSRSDSFPENWSDNSTVTNSLSEIKEVDLAIIAVSDNAISEVSKQLSTELIVHTSGSIPMNSLKNNSRKGIFYPLQTFTKDDFIDFKNVPFCLETEDENDMILLEKLAMTLGSKFYHINSEQRKNLHVAAVFANNFTNHLYGLAKEFCDENNVPFEILHPIVKSTASKATENNPFEIQTGPAKRNDKITIENHLNLLSDNQKELYQLMTKSIQKYGKKL